MASLEIPHGSRSHEQLYVFLRTCSLGRQQIEYVLSQWTSSRHPGRC